MNRSNRKEGWPLIRCNVSNLIEPGKLANQAGQESVSRARNSVTTGSEERRIPGARANVKTHLVHPHVRIRPRRVPTPTTAKIPMEQPMTGMTCTRCRTEDPSLLRHSFHDLSPPSLSPIRRLCGPLWTGYLLRGRCRLNLINSMRHLDKCAPRTRIQRIIFILIHLPFPSSTPAPPTFFFLSSFSTAPYLEPFLRLSDPRFILVKP